MQRGNTVPKDPGAEEEREEAETERQGEERARAPGKGQARSVPKHDLRRMDQVPPDVPVILALTGLDEQPDSIGLFEFAGQAMADGRLPIVLLCAFEDVLCTIIK